MRISDAVPVLASMLLAGPASAGEASGRSVAVFTAPLAAGEAVALSPLTATQMEAFIPLGINFTAGELDWALDAAFVYLSVVSLFDGSVSDLLDGRSRSRSRAL